MESAPRPKWSIAPVLAIIGLAFFASRAGGPDVVVSAPATAESVESGIYLWIDAIEGEGTDGLHKGFLEILAGEQGVWSDPYSAGTGLGPDLRARERICTGYGVCGKPKGAIHTQRPDGTCP